MRPPARGVVVLAAAFAAVVVGASRPDADRGRRLFEKRCTGCHALDSPKAGPALRKVFGRASGSDPKYPYSDALKGARISWNEAALEQWLADPERLAPGTDMEFRLNSAAERADIIAYLKRLSR